ncbi:MAG: tellurite resistance TerB family protein [Flavobacteriales bacterium]
MSIINLFESGEHSRNLGHFASLANIALSDGMIDSKENKLLNRFARRLEITDEEYKKVMKNPNQYPINPPNSSEKRLERFYDLFKMVFADEVIDDEERMLMKKYAIGLGYPEDQARKLMKRSIEIFQGGIDLDDYRYLLNKN